MSNWKKLVVSGSQAHLASVTASNGSIISGSLTMSGSIVNVDNLNFYTTSSAAGAVGRFVWNDGDGTLDLGLKGGNVTLQLGQEQVARVYNAEATTLNDGEIVYIFGSQGNRISVKRAGNSAEEGSRNTLGMVTEPILAGQEGFVTTGGVVNKLNTIGLTSGATLYLSTNGGYTQTKPVAPNHTVIIGFVERVHASVGSIFVKIDNGYELGELHDIIDTSTTSSYGDLLVKSESVWVNTKQLTGSYGLTGSLQATSFTGSLQGTATTASYVLNAVSSSFATTASYVLGGGGGATVTNPGNNFVITSDGTSGGLVGEDNLSFNGSILNVTGSVIANRYTGSLQYFDYNTNTNTSNGIGIGLNSIGNILNGIGIGIGASSNETYGIGIGNNANRNYTYGIGIGNNANYNYNHGIGIGNGALENSGYSVGIGYQSQYNSNYGVGIGSNTSYNSEGGVGIGYYATTNQKGYGTVAIGANSKAERQNEFVTTATNSTTNKAQSIIQKFREKSLASSGGVLQELFTDASSARVTILASSVYQFRFQINAIETSTFVCKTWEVVGAIKRNSSNNTTMVRNPIYIVTSAEAGSANWDVTVDADDTNEALRLRVKHDAANNVIFSATIWATETRI